MLTNVSELKMSQTADLAFAVPRNSDLNEVNCRILNVFFPKIININHFNLKPLCF